MKAAVAIAVALTAGIGGFLAWVYTSESTDCYASFNSPEAAERAAAIAQAAGFEAEVDERARQTAVTFSDGETGDDAAAFREAFGQLVEVEDGTLGHPGNGCLERGMLD
jgi:hypothetical protein